MQSKLRRTFLGGLTFLTVKGAGHMVPKDRPRHGLDVGGWLLILEQLAELFLRHEVDLIADDTVGATDIYLCVSN